MLYVAAPSSECHEVLTNASLQGVMFVDVHLCLHVYICISVCVWGQGRGLQQCQLLHWSGVHVVC